MIKYIASDLDGTLLQNGAQKPDNETLELIRRLTEAGIHFIAASGRQYINMYRMFGPVQDMISYVSENGALVMDQHKAVTKGSLDRDLVLRITEYAKGYPACNCQLSCESCCYTDSKDPFYIKHMTDVVQYDMAVVDNLADIKEPFLKLAMCDFPAKELPQLNLSSAKNLVMRLRSSLLETSGLILSHQILIKELLLKSWYIILDLICLKELLSAISLTISKCFRWQATVMRFPDARRALKLMRTT